MFQKLILAIPLIVASGVAGAQTYTAENHLKVQPVAGGGFSVPSSGRFGARGAWCAAADYAMDVLGKSGTTRIYVQQPIASRSGPVVFGLDPAGAAPMPVTGTTSALRVAGSNLSIDHAIQFCWDARLTNNR